MTDRSRRRSIWIAEETTYAVDPSTDGSGYVSVPAEGLGDLVDQKLKLDTDYSTDREWPTPVEEGADGAEISFGLPLYGLLAAAGDGTDASSNTDDCWDIILEHIFGVQVTTSGDTASAAFGASAVTTTTDEFDLEDVMLVHDPATALDRAQARLVTVDGGDGTYTVSPAFDETPANATAVIYGGKHYRPNAPFLGGNTISAVYSDSSVGTYHLGGGRVTAFSIEGEVNARVMASITIRFDRVTLDAGKSSLPATFSAPPTTTIQARWSPFYFNGTAYDTRKISVDFGLTANPVNDTDQENGRSDDEMITMAPVANIMPLRTEAIRVLGRQVTQGITLMQFGSGALAGGKVNAFAIVFRAGQVQQANFAADNGIARNDVNVHAVDHASDTLHFVQVVRY